MKNLIILFVFICLLAGCSEDPEIVGPTSGTIKYEVVCTPDGFDITYENSSGNTEQKTIATGSWETSFTQDSGEFVYISAQAANENADVTVKIYYNGKVIEEASSSGDFIIATASGSVP